LSTAGDEVDALLGFLQQYVDILGEFLETDRKSWEPYQARITAAQAGLKQTS